VKIIMCHNHYQQPGGEDLSYAQEVRLIESRGHDVVQYTKHNDEIREMGKLAAALRTIWNGDTHRELRELFRHERPEVVHFTNTFPLISSSAYYAAKEEGVAVVQSLRNYRLLCPGAQFMRDGKVCESCLGKRFAWPGVWHGCYRDSRVGTLVVASMLAFHRMRQTWTEAIDMYYALTELSRAKFVEGGLPADKIAVKPNFIEPAPEPGTGSGGFAVFVGRLSEEKGIDVLLDAWKQLDLPLELKIVGDGPMAATVESAAKEDARIQWLGRLPSDEAISIVGEALCLVMPSLWYEGFPRTILEALAKGTPVVTSRLGSMEEIVEDRVTGLHFTAGDSSDLVRALHRITSDPLTLGRMRRAARDEFLANYTEDANYNLMMEIYAKASGKPRKDLEANSIPDIVGLPTNVLSYEQESVS
jgi:glycosyltransferase involved in cell wall biosynthesis